MEVILLERIHNLGDLGQSVDVANGYARNFLIPQKKAVPATAEAKAEVEKRRRELAAEESKRQEAAQARADLAAREVRIPRLAGEGGKLYGSVSPADIAEALTAAGVKIERSEILQPDGPIKQLGEYRAEVILHPEVRFDITVVVPAEEGSAAQEAAAIAESAEPDEPGEGEPPAQG